MSPRSVRLLAGGVAACAMALTTIADVGLAQAGGAPGAQGGTPAWLRARLDNRLDPRTRAAVEHVIDSARAAGVAPETLVDKALEGASKGAPGSEIVRVVQQLAARLTTARGALGSTSLASEVAAGAEALRAGVDPGALARLRHDRPGQPLTVALGVLADLIARGVPVPEATQGVLALTRVGSTDEQLVAFRRDVERDIGLGAPPAAVATLRATGLALNISGGASGPAPAGSRPPGTPRQKP